MSYYVYILRSLKNGRFYIGHTSDLNKRIDRHNSGGSIYTRNSSIYTRNIRPLRLVKYEIYDSRSSAMAREKKIKIKSYKGGDEFKRLIENILQCGGDGVVNRT